MTVLITVTNLDELTMILDNVLRFGGHLVDNKITIDHRFFWKEALYHATGNKMQIGVVSARV